MCPLRGLSRHCRTWPHQPTSRPPTHGNHRLERAGCPSRFSLCWQSAPMQQILNGHQGLDACFAMSTPPLQTQLFPNLGALASVGSVTHPFKGLTKRQPPAHGHAAALSLCLSSLPSYAPVLGILRTRHISHRRSRSKLPSRLTSLLVRGRLEPGRKMEGTRDTS